MAQIVLDVASFPGLSRALAVAREAGAAGWGAYLGGPSITSAGPWPVDGCRALIATGLGLLPIYDGRQAGWRLDRASGLADGADASRLMAAYGFGRGGICTLDVESGTASQPGGPAYIGGWVDSLRSGGYRPGVYGTVYELTTFVAHLGTSTPDFVWVASPQGQAPIDPGRDPARIPGFPDDLFAGPGRRAWQYRWEYPIGGLSVDVSTSDLPLVGSTPTPEEDEMPFTTFVKSEHHVNEQVDIPGVNTKLDDYWLAVRNAYGPANLQLQVVWVNQAGAIVRADSLNLAPNVEQDLEAPADYLGTLVLQQPSIPYAYTLKCQRR